MGVTREACPECGSKDNLARYDDGHAYCFGYQCGYYEHADGGTEKRDAYTKVVGLVAPLDYIRLKKRGLSQEACEFMGYGVGEFSGQMCQVAEYRDEHGSVVAQKVRLPGKEFKFLGEPDKATLYGKHKCSPGKIIVITEGEIDAVSVAQAQGLKWATVSIPNGAQGAAKTIKKELDWLEENFESVVLMFDQDEAGQGAAEQCAQLFAPGKCKIAKLPRKDVNEMLVEGEEREIIHAIFRAEPYRPDGIVSGQDTWEMIITEPAPGIPYPWEKLNELTYGMRRGEIVTFCAGSGTGKSLVCREVAHYLHAQGETIGYVALEESPRRTALGLMSIEANKPLHLGMGGVSEEEIRNAWEATVGSGRCYLYDHWGSLDSDVLLNRLRYLARGLDCGWLVLDHLSIVVSGIGDGDERRLIDNTMTAVRSLVEETGVGLLLVSHLRRPLGNKGHEDGQETSLSHLRGSASIAQLSDIVVGLERNQQADGSDADTTILRVLKNRHAGLTGVAGALKYNRESGRLSEGDAEEYFEESKEDGKRDY